MIYRAATFQTKSQQTPEFVGPSVAWPTPDNVLLPVTKRSNYTHRSSIACWQMEDMAMVINKHGAVILLFSPNNNFFRRVIS